MKITFQIIIARRLRFEASDERETRRSDIALRWVQCAHPSRHRIAIVYLTARQALTPSVISSVDHLRLYAKIIGNLQSVCDTMRNFNIAVFEHR